MEKEEDALNNKRKGVLSRVFNISSERKGLLIISVFASVIGMVSGVVPYLSVYFIGKHYLVNGLSGTNEIIFWVIVSAEAIVCNTVFTFLGSLGCHTVAFQILLNYRLHVMEHLGKLSMSFFSSNSSGSIQKIMDENIEKIEGFIAHMLPDMIGSFAVLIILLLGVGTLSIPLAITILIASIIGFSFQFMIFGGSKSKQIWADISRASANTTGTFSEYVKGMAEVKLFGKIGSITRTLENNIKEYLTWEVESYKRSAAAMSMYKSIILSLLTFVLPVGIYLILKNPTGNMVLSVLMALIIVPAIYDPLMACVEYATMLGMLGAGMDQIDEILAQPKINSAKLQKVPKDWEIEFKNVSFSYGDDDDAFRKMALNDINFTAKQGEMTALVGESGSGKSTIGGLLLRFWDNFQGEISIGRVDIRDIPNEKLMDYVAFVFQDNFIFSDTVRGNIIMNRNVSDEEMIEASKKARCHEFIMKLPEGYDTKIGSGSIKLSGGEAQRLSIARAILKDSPIIVLDEALAYSDAENENLIQMAIKNLIEDKTIIIIAHRLQSIMTADQVLVLRQGEIIEQGTHSSLLGKDAEYKMLWELQHKTDDWSITMSKKEGQHERNH